MNSPPRGQSSARRAETAAGGSVCSFPCAPFSPHTYRNTPGELSNSNRAALFYRTELQLTRLIHVIVLCCKAGVAKPGAIRAASEGVRVFTPGER